MAAKRDVSASSSFFPEVLKFPTISDLQIGEPVISPGDSGIRNFVILSDGKSDHLHISNNLIGLELMPQTMQEMIPRNISADCELVFRIILLPFDTYLDDERSKFNEMELYEKYNVFGNYSAMYVIGRYKGKPFIYNLLANRSTLSQRISEMIENFMADVRHDSPESQLRRLVQRFFVA